jgi:hypothetical protein
VVGASSSCWEKPIGRGIHALKGIDVYFEDCIRMKGYSVLLALGAACVPASGTLFGCTADPTDQMFYLVHINETTGSFTKLRAFDMFAVYSSYIDTAKQHLYVETSHGSAKEKYGVQTIDMHTGKQIGKTVELDTEPNTPVVDGFAVLTDKIGALRWVGTRFEGGMCA